MLYAANRFIVTSIISLLGHTHALREIYHKGTSLFFFFFLCVSVLWMNFNRFSSKM